MRVIFLTTIIASALSFFSCGRISNEEPIPESSYPNFSIQFVGKQNGWILGPLIQRTYDGGLNWSILKARRGYTPILASDGPAPVRYFFQFVDRSHGWMISNTPYEHSVQYTEDGGYSWSKPIKVSDRLYPTALLFVSPGKGWVLGFEKVLLTYDGGKNWDEDHSLAKLSLYYPFMLDQNHIWFASSYGVLAGTSDGGKNWIIKHTLPKGVKCIYFINPLSGWAIGSEGLVANTEDGGENWLIHDVPIPAVSETRKTTLLDVFFLNSETGWIVGYEGLVLLTKDGGKTWSRSSTPTRAPLGSVRFVDETRGWAVGGNAKPAFPAGTPSNVIIETTDGGKSWHIK